MGKDRVRPACKLSGANGNIYNLLAIASISSRNEGLNTEADEMWTRATNSCSHEEALSIIGEYVEIN